MRVLARLFFVLVLCLPLQAQNKYAFDFAPSLLKNQTIKEQDNPVDVTHYDVEVSIDMQQQSIKGRANISLSLLDGATSFFLHLTSPQVTKAKINGQETSFQHALDKIYFTVDNPIPSINLELEYGGTPGNDGFGGFYFQNNYVYTVGQGLNSEIPSMLRHWIPSHDVPFDKATLDLRLTVPEDQDAFSNGVLISTDTTGGQKTFHWRETHPIATYLIAIAVGDYVTLQKDYTSISGHAVPLEFYVFPEDVEKAENDWRNLPSMMEFFERQFSLYPFDRYSMAQAYNRGAMEHQTMTTYSYQLITGDNRYDYIVAHELAHHWWGDLVTLGDWRDIWLNEGFATYSEALYFESQFGQEYLSRYMDMLMDVYLGEVARRGHFPIYDPDYMWGGTIYQKGAWVLHMLRWTIGDAAFWRTLQTWADRYAYGNALIPDFIELAEEQSGQELQWFFDQWIYQAGYPDLDIAWRVEKANTTSFKVTVDIKQQQWDQFEFVAPLEIQFETAKGAVLDTLVSSSRQQTFELEFDTMPRGIVIDPQNWLLKQYDVISDPSPPGVSPNDFYLSQNYPNPFIHGGQTQISYQVAQMGSPYPVSLTIYNILGRRVATLIDARMQGGMYKIIWDGKDMNGKIVPSGVYFYQLQSEQNIIEKKMVIFEK